MRTAAITIAHGRHTHWAAQCAAMARARPGPDRRILVAIDDPYLASWAEHARTGVDVLEVEADTAGLPLARARNAGAARAIADGAELLVFLDVDCLPCPELFDAYVAAATAEGGRLHCGPVTYLPPAPHGGYDLTRLADLDDPHPARPAPAPGELLHDDRHELFWSLSFAVTADTWTRIGGFHEEYVGYGGEDTDFGQAAAAAGVGMCWVGGARAYHQHHEVESPPVRHLDAIIRNGRVFRDRWGWWPMGGWLDEFEELGLVAREADGDYAIRHRPRH
ncbi:glycosyltransferase family 2 protein [Microbacterium sp. GXF7504]